MDLEVIRVLLVDDDEDYYVLTRDLLSQAKETRYELEWVSTYNSGLDAIKRDEHDVCLLDYHLGERTGMELLREAVKNGCRLPLILVTGVGDHQVDLEAMQAGASDYLVKGHFDFNLLDRSIRYSIARKRSEEELRKLSRAVEQSPAIVMITDKEGRIEYVNPKFTATTGYTREEVLGKTPALLESGENPQHIYQEMWRGAASGGEWKGQLQNRKKDGEPFWVSVSISPVKNSQGAVSHLLAVEEDITERKQLEDTLIYNALHDPLTDLPNRAVFMDRLGLAFERSKRHDDYAFAVLYLDVDRFKIINDSLGHMIGDRVLIEIAHRLLTCVRACDTVARLGGDEFAIILDNVRHVADIEGVANRVLKKLTIPFVLGEQEIYSSISIGIALNTAGFDKKEYLLGAADTALYTAKANGKARYEIFRKGLTEDAQSLLYLEADMRQAIDRQEFELYYQPVLSLKRSEIIAVEALMRWQHPRRGFVSPATFIPLAEETGLIVRIGEWVLRTACKQMRVWQETGLDHLHMKVNFSARQFQSKNLMEMVSRVLDETAADPHSLEIEITESTAIRDIDFTIRTLKELSSRGIRISLDDFGTGYSSMGLLKRFPIHSLKIDQSFVREIPQDADAQSIAKAIIDLAHNLKMLVIAEGVETEGQLGFLKANACDEAQGYLFSRPLPAEAVTRFLAASRETSDAGAPAISERG